MESNDNLVPNNITTRPNDDDKNVSNEDPGIQSQINIAEFSREKSFAKNIVNKRTKFEWHLPKPSK